MKCAVGRTDCTLRSRLIGKSKGVKKKLTRLLIWLSVLPLIFVSLGLNLTRAQAKTPDTTEETTVQFAKESGQGKENVVFPMVKVNLLPEVIENDVEVNFEVTGGTAIPGIDYKMENGVATIQAGKISTNLPLEILDNHIVEPARTIIISLSNAVGATLTEPTTFTYTILDDDSLPVTTVLTNPSTPNGQNGWFIEESPKIDFLTDRVATTYYKWNTLTKNHWQEYDNTPLVVPEGPNTLYYYSVDTFGNREETKAEVIKVDTLVPIWPETEHIWATTDENGYVHLSWSSIEDASSYEVWRAASPYQLITSDVVNTSFLDDTVSGGNQYSYEVFAVDQAGNKSIAAEVSILVPVIAKPVSETLSASTEEITPTIGGSTVTQEVQGETNETPKSTEVAENTEQASQNQTETETRNWNRLLLAISILIIAAGAAIGGYYGYEWWMAKREETLKDNEPRSKSRW